jgi:hypothetical protein
MRQLFVLLLLLVLSNLNAFSQNLSLAELIKLRAKDADQINDYLLPKGWNFIKREYDIIKWSHSTISSKVDAWFFLHIVENDNGNALYSYDNDYIGNYIYCHNSDMRNLAIFKDNLLQNGFKKTSTDTENNSIIIKYKSSNYFIKLTLYSNEDNIYKRNYFTIELHKVKRTELLK